MWMIWKESGFREADGRIEAYKGGSRNPQTPDGHIEKPTKNEVEVHIPVSPNPEDHIEEEDEVHQPVSPTPEDYIDEDRVQIEVHRPVSAIPYGHIRQYRFNPKYSFNQHTTSRLIVGSNITASITIRNSQSPEEQRGIEIE